MTHNSQTEKAPPGSVQPACSADGRDDWFDGQDEEPNNTCPNCHGTGGEPYDDGITPCEKCDGEGYLWWLP
jgi:DnaJ-class molecular chaperone